MSNEEKKNSGLLKKIGIPAAVAAIILLLGLNAFSAYRYFNIKADNDKLYAQNEEYEDNILRLTTLNEQQTANTNNNDNDNNSTCGNPGCSSYCQGTCTGDCQGNCGNCVNSCMGNCVAYTGACPWDDEAWLDKFADIIAGKRAEASPDEDIEDEALTEENDADEEELEDEQEADEEDADLVTSNKKKTASVKRSITRTSNAQTGLAYSIDPALQLYYQLISSPEYQRQLAYYNAVRRNSYVNLYSSNNSSNSNNSNSSSSSNKSSSSSSQSSSNTSSGSNSSAGDPASPGSDPGNTSGGNSGNGDPGSDPGSGNNQEESILPGYKINIFRETAEVDPDRSVFLKNINVNRVSDINRNWNSAYLKAHTITDANDEEIEVLNKKHTLILYMLASDLEKYDQGVLTEDIARFLNNADYDPDSLNVVLCVGAAEQFQNDYFKQYVDDEEINDDYKYKNGCALFYVDAKNLAANRDLNNEINPDCINEETLIYLGSLVDDKANNDDEFICSMYDPETLTTVLDIAGTNFSADEYSLIMWDHGGGIIGGFGSQKADEDSKGVGMPVTDISKALYDSIIYDKDNAVHGKLAFIGFDACLMGGIETIDALSPYADFCVASAEITAGGWDYAGIANYIASISDENSTYNKNKKMAQEAAALYAKQDSHKRNDSCTDSVAACFELSSIKPIMDDIESISNGLNQMIVLPAGSSETDIKKAKDDLFKIVHNARSKAYSYGLDKTSRKDIQYDYVDIKDFYTLLCAELDNYLKNSTVGARVKEIICGENYASYVDIETVDGGIIKTIKGLISKLDAASSNEYVNWLGYNGYDPDVAGKSVAGSKVGCLSMYMPFMYSPIDDGDGKVEDVEREFDNYKSQNGKEDTGYSKFLAEYFASELAHRNNMKKDVAPTIDYNNIFKAKARILLKTGELQDYDTVDYANNIGNVASTVIQLSKKDNVDYKDYEGKFEEFKDTVEKITAVITKKIEDPNAPVPANPNDPPAYIDGYDLVVAKNDVELSDVSAGSIDIGIYDYTKADTYQISGTAFKTVPNVSSGTSNKKLVRIDDTEDDYTSGNLVKANNDKPALDYATPVTSAVFDKEISGLMAGMREKLIAANNDGNTSLSQDDIENEAADDSIWHELQGKVTKWINGVKSTVEAAVLHFRADDNSDTYTFYGASTITNEDTHEQEYKVGDDTFYIGSSRTAGSLVDDDPTDSNDIVYTISFYHYVIGANEEVESNAPGASPTTVEKNRYMLVTAGDDISKLVNADSMTQAEKDAASFNEAQISDAAAHSIIIEIEQPEYAPDSLTLTVTQLASIDPDAVDYTDSAKLEAAAKAAYDDNAKIGYGALIQSTADENNTTAIAPAYIDENQVASGIGGDVPEVEAGQSSSSNPGAGMASRKVDSSSSVTNTSNSDTFTEDAISADAIPVAEPVPETVDMINLAIPDATEQLSQIIETFAAGINQTEQPTAENQQGVTEFLNTNESLTDSINNAIEESSDSEIQSSDESSSGESSPSEETHSDDENSDSNSEEE